jgi:hypothetical protein
MNKAKSKRVIFAYGFDAAGFGPAGESIDAEHYVIHFVGHRATQSLEHADGVIMPSGIFEKIESSCGMGRTSTWIEFDKDHLAKREKEVYQNLKRGGWTAFLLQQVDNFHGKYNDTDLAKWFLQLGCMY